MKKPGLESSEEHIHISYERRKLMFTFYDFEVFKYENGTVKKLML